MSIVVVVVVVVVGGGGGGGGGCFCLPFLYFQGSLNYPFWGNQTMQIDGNFGFPL